MKSYIYHGAFSDTRIDYDDRKGTLTLEKLNPEKHEVPKMVVKKHSISVGDDVIQKSKARNFVRELKKSIIDSGLRDGTCEVYTKGEN